MFLLKRLGFDDENCVIVAEGKRSSTVAGSMYSEKINYTLMEKYLIYSCIISIIHFPLFKILM